LRVLLDTHVFLWWVKDDSRLSSRVRDIVSDGDNEVMFSAASGWEIAIKAGLGHLSVEDGLERFVADSLEENALRVLPIHLRHMLRMYDLPDHHRDPFDRLLVAQAQVEEVPLLTADPEIGRYPVQVIW
jgi:PIN domain nuclease of toxin-antitoxin system